MSEDLCFMPATQLELGTPDFDSTIAHEVQHMIHWYQHERDDTWINEGSSVLAQVLNGYMRLGRGLRRND
jgi:predicted SprT family Zn-dependent metalloprotease